MKQSESVTTLSPPLLIILALCAIAAAVIALTPPRLDTQAMFYETTKW